MDYANPDALVQTEWLAGNLNAPGLKIVEATYFLPSMKRDAREEFGMDHIPGAVFFDIDDISDPSSGLPHMLPDAETFAAKVGALGIGNDDRVIVYDASGGHMAAARAWWMFRLFGHPNVALLNGGFPKWLRETRNTEEGFPSPSPGAFTARMNPALARNLEQMLANLESRTEQVADARGPGRFRGEEPEPRPTPKSGHIPASLNLPFPSLMDPENCFVMRPAEELEKTIVEAGIDLDGRTVASCGSGVTACVIALAFHLLGRSDVAVYDGSWAEWGEADETPVEI